MPECSTCGIATLMPGRCSRCSQSALSKYQSLTVERDRLAAENAELRASIETISDERNIFLQQRTDAIDKGVYWQDKSGTYERMLRTANATLDKLRDAMPEGGTASMLDALIIIGNFYAVLYPQETPNDDR